MLLFAFKRQLSKISRSERNSIRVSSARNKPIPYAYALKLRLFIYPLHLTRSVNLEPSLMSLTEWCHREKKDTGRGHFVRHHTLARGLADRTFLHITKVTTRFFLLIKRRPWSKASILQGVEGMVIFSSEISGPQG